MIVYKIEAIVIDFDELGPDGIKSEIDNARYPNHWNGPRVITIEGVDIGEWDDDNPLNGKGRDAEYRRLFPSLADAHADRIAAIRKQLETRSPFHPFYADVKFLLDLLEKT